MTFPKYYVSYGFMGMDAKANPFGHACLYFSEQTAENSPIEIKSAVGFYSQPSTTTNPCVKNLKQMLGFTVDLQNVHGTLKEELMRYIDGPGQNSINFETTETAYNRLKEKCSAKIKAEEEAIADLNRQLETRNKPANGVTRLALENELATQENRPSRLTPFHVDLQFKIAGVDSSRSRTCKTAVLDLMEEAGVISRDIRRKIVGGAAKMAFPRFSTIPSEPVRFVSCGQPEKEFTKNRKQHFFNRTWKNNRIFWATPFHLYQEDLSEKTLLQRKKIYAVINQTLNQLQAAEIALWYQFDSAKTTPQLKKHLAAWLAQFEKVYQSFSHSHENVDPERLQPKLEKARALSSAANLVLHPERANYSFLLSAATNVSLYYTILGVLCLAATATFLTGAIAVTAMVASATYGSYHSLNFFRKERAAARSREHYRLLKMELPPDESTEHPSELSPVGAPA